MCLLDIHGPSFEKWLLKYFAHLSIELFLFLSLSFKGPSCFLDTSPLLDIEFGNTSSQSGVVFSLSWWCPSKQKILAFDEVQFTYLPFIICGFSVLFKNSLPSPRAQRFASWFYSKYFIFMIHFELMFVYGVRYGVKFFLLHMHYKLSWQHLLKRLFFPSMNCFVTSVKKKKNQMAINVRASFWIPDSVPLIYTSVLTPIPHCLGYGSKLGNWKVWVPQLYSSF